MALDLSTLCKNVYHRCAATHSQFAFVQGLFRAAGYRLGLTESYAKQLFSGKNFSEDLKNEMRGKNNLDALVAFFSGAIEDTRTQTVLIAFGIPEKNEPNKKALAVALAKQTRAIIEVTDDAEAPDIVGLEYQAAKAAPAIQASTSPPPEPLYPGDDVYVDSGRRYESGSREDIPHTWVLQNTGKIRWEKRKLVYRRGPKDRPEAIPSEVNIPDTPPGGFVHLTTVFNGRGFDAVTTCLWVMVDEDGADCFPNRSSLFSITIDAKYKR